MKDLRGWWLEDRGEERAWVDLMGWDEKQRNHYEFGWEEELCLGVRDVEHRSVHRIKCRYCVRWLLFFISLSVNLKALEDGDYNALGFRHEPGEAAAPAAFPEQAATSLLSLLCCPLHADEATICLTAQWTGKVENKREERGKELEVLQQLSCTTRAWRKALRNFPHGQGLSGSLEARGAGNRTENLVWRSFCY